MKGLAGIWKFGETVELCGKADVRGRENPPFAINKTAKGGPLREKIKVRIISAR